MRRFAVPVLVVVQAACGPAEPPPLSLGQQRMEATASAELAAAGLRRGAGVAACGTEARIQAPATLVNLNAQQCLSCRDLGYMLRRLPAAGSTAFSAPVLVVPESDTAAVCPFLRQERIRLPVLSIPDRDRRIADARTLVMYSVRSDWSVDSVSFATTGADMLKRISAAPAVPPPPATAEPLRSK